jgi:hypothetical protein
LSLGDRCAHFTYNQPVYQHLAIFDQSLQALTRKTGQIPDQE